MSPSKGTRDRGASYRRTALVLLLAGGPVCYGIGLWTSSVIDRCALGSTVCLEPAALDQLTLPRLTAAAAMAVGAVLLLFAAPWMLGTLAIRRIPGRRATAGAWSLAVNSAALVLVCLVLRNTVGIDRRSFFIGWMAWSGALLLAAWKPAPASGEIGRPLRRWGPGMLIGLAAVILGAVLFCREQFVQCFNGDSIETFQLARSLRDHLLPYFEIETEGRFGTVVVTPSLVNSYWTCAVQLLLGEGELATRLPFWIWSLGVFGVSLSVVQPDDQPCRWLPAVPLALGMLLWAVWYTFHTGYYPYMADLGNLGVSDMLFTLFVLLALECLRRGDDAGWIVSMVFASLVHYAGPVMVVLTVLAALLWQPIARRRTVRAAATCTGVLAGVALFYLGWGWLEGSLSGWASTLRLEYVEEYFSPVPRWRSGLLFGGYFLLGCGAIPAIALICAFRSNSGDQDAAWDRTVATVAVAYLLIVMGAGYKNLHYLGPLLPIPLILWLKPPQHPARRALTGWAAALAAGGGLAFSVCLCWPASRPLFTLNRDLGAITTFQTDSYEEACRWARMSRELYDAEVIGWYVGGHTWVHYSELAADPAKPRSLVVTDQEAPSARYELLLESAEGAKLYGRDPEEIRWAGLQRPPSGPDRCPWVFRPIAIPPPVRRTE